MCGIVAIRSNGQPAGAWQLVEALRALAHRGPDDSGSWVSDDGRIALGHRRLSIVDFETGWQPLKNEDGSVMAIVNGEFYDYQRIRRDLTASGHRFATKSDSEVLLHLYEDKSVECLEDLRGEFAFVLWDSRRRRLFAARDRFGIKPLYFAETRDRLIIASEIKALFAAGISPSWDSDSVFRQLCATHPADQTLFQQVRQVPAGHYLVESSGRVAIARYWDSSYPESADTGTAAEMAEGELIETLSDAVATRLVADVPVGCLLSGGIDSSIICMLANGRREEPLDVYTVEFARTAFDEAARAESLARELDARWRALRIDYTDLAKHVSDAIWHAEGVGYNGQAVARYLLAGMIRNHGTKAVLSGEGADEIFGGYPFCLLDAQGAAPAGEKGARGLALAEIRSRLGSVPAVLSTLMELRQPVVELLSTDFTHRYRSINPWSEILDGLNCEAITGWHPLHQSLYIWRKTIFPNYVLMQDRLDMAHGLEARLPFLDHRLFDIAKTIPGDRLVRPGRDKHLLRGLFATRLPAEIVERRKHPFTAPLALLDSNNRLFEWIQDTLRSSAMRALTFLDQSRVARLADSLGSLTSAGRAAVEPAVMAVCSLAVLQQRYLYDKEFHRDQRVDQRLL